MMFRVHLQDGYYFQVDVPAPTGGLVEIYMVRGGSRSLTLRTLVAPNSAEQAVVNQLTPEEAKTLSDLLQVEAARTDLIVLPTTPVGIPLVSFVPIANSLDKERVTKALSDLDNTMIRLHGTISLFVREHHQNR
jgi:hypothetical protein